MAPQWLRAAAVEARLARGSATSAAARGTTGGVKGAICPKGPNDPQEDATELEEIGVSLPEVVGAVLPRRDSRNAFSRAKPSAALAWISSASLRFRSSAFTIGVSGTLKKTTLFQMAFFSSTVCPDQLGRQLREGQPNSTWRVDSTAVFRIEQRH